ncbi:MAG TPA: hypothetical protein VEI52_10060 [Terriglobales bacterium]|nr:hypothetical protein [Terriglobales bacterium]
MFIPKLREHKTLLMVAMALLAWLALPACSVSVKDHDKSGNSKVDIDTPFGGIHVNEDADVRDTGLEVYPGARLKPKTSDEDTKSANVNISSGVFGLKVVAVEYESDDAPAKILTFYREQLKKYGGVVECHSDRQAGDLHMKAGEQKPKPVNCEGNNSGNVIELKTGTEENQHIVSVEPQGKGSDFSLVYIRTRGKQGSI